LKDLSVYFDSGEKITKRFIDFLTKSITLNRFHILVLLSFSFILLFVNNRLIYGCINMLDLKQHLRIFQGAYYGSRLPWILFGASLFKVFGKYMGIYMLRYSVLYITMFSVYGIVKRIFDIRTAFVVSLFTLFCFPILLSNEICYIDGFANSLLLLVLYLLLPVELDRLKLWRIAISGGVASCMIFTQMFLLVYLPVIVAFWFLFNKMPIRMHIKPALVFCLGFMLATVLFCIVNYTFTHNFWFFLSSVSFLKHSVAASNPYWYPAGSWLYKATWLILPLIAFIGSVFVVIANLATNSGREFNHGVGLQYIYIMAVSIFLFLEFVCREPVLLYSYYSSYLIPVMILSLAYFFKRTMLLNDYKFNLFLLFVFIGSQFFVASNVFPVALPISKVILVSISLGLLGLIAAFFKNNIAKTIAAIWFLAAFSVVAHYIWCVDPSSFNRRKSHFHALVDGITEINKYNSRLKGKFWYSSSSAVGPLFTAIASSNLWGYRLLSHEYPKTNIFPKKGDVLVVMTDDIVDLDQINSQLNCSELTCKCKLSKEVGNQDVKFYVTFLDVINSI